VHRAPYDTPVGSLRYLKPFPCFTFLNVFKLKVCSTVPIPVSAKALWVKRARDEEAAKKEAKRLTRKASHESSKAFGE
jgi:hypothetical protein